MQLHHLTLTLFLTSSVLSFAPQYIFANHEHKTLHIPTIHESAVQARRILNISDIGTISTVFPHSSNSDISISENRPADVQGAPIGLTEYYASCGLEPFNPTILGITITTEVKNARAGSNVTLSLRYHPPADHPPSNDPYEYVAANLPRFSLVGYLENLSDEEVEAHNIAACFVRQHPDAALWTPGNDIHESFWARLVVQEVYWFGGFGDRARIGWLPVEEWRSVTEKEVDNTRLVGEQGYTEDQYLAWKSGKAECNAACTAVNNTLHNYSVPLSGIDASKLNLKDLATGVMEFEDFVREKKEQAARVLAAFERGVAKLEGEISSKTPEELLQTLSDFNTVSNSIQATCAELKESIAKAGV